MIVDVMEYGQQSQETFAPQMKHLLVMYQPDIQFFTSGIRSLSVKHKKLQVKVHSHVECIVMLK